MMARFFIMSSAFEKSARAAIARPFSHGKSRHLKAFARYVVELCCIMTLRNVSRLLGVSWDLVKGLHKSSLSNRLKKRRLSKVRYIAADEFSTHKGHKYMTVVLKGDRKTVIKGSRFLLMEKRS